MTEPSIYPGDPFESVRIDLEWHVRRINDAIQAEYEPRIKRCDARGWVKLRAAIFAAMNAERERQLKPYFEALAAIPNPPRITLKLSADEADALRARGLKI